ncbi:alpha/beta hydrolase fold-domain-containing protein [Schizophyllum commune]
MTASAINSSASTPGPSKTPSPPSSSAVTPSPSSIQITHRSDRSLATHIIHTSLRTYRPIGQAFSRPGSPYPPGSPWLSPNASWTDGCKLTERHIEGIYVYDLVRSDDDAEDGTSPVDKSHHTSPPVERRIYFVAGGSWRQPPTKEHWKFVSKLAYELPRTAISVISVPLAPRETAPTVYPRLLALYERAMADAEANGERVIWAGDSSGGNIVLALIGEVLRIGRRGDTKTAIGLETEAEWRTDEQAPTEEREKKRPLPTPAALLLICPSVDAKRNNPEIARIQKVDPVLDAEESQRHAAEWAGEWGLDDERVSPVLSDKEDHVVKLLRERGVHVHGVTAGHDILGPDGIKLRNKLAKEGVEGKWLEWDKMMHCFSLAWFYGLPESKEALQWIIDVLKGE